MLGRLQGLHAAGTPVTVGAKTSILVGFSVISIARATVSEGQNEDVVPIAGEVPVSQTQNPTSKTSNTLSLSLQFL